jgi:histidyl-tRNA synthetase
MKLQNAKGVQDFLPKEKIVRNEVVDILKETFEKYGFLPLETPVLERYETLAAKFAAGTGSDIMKEIFTLKDQGKRKLGLRFDLTVPLARFVGMNPNLRMPFKRYEIGRVFRDGPIKLGRRREFWQADIDIIGSNSMMAEAELLSVADEVFKRLGLNFVIKVNNRKLLNSILETAGISKRKEEVILSVDKLEKIGEAGVKKELKGKGFNKGISGLLKILKIKNLNLLKNKIKSKEGQEGIEELKELFDCLRTLKVKVEFDASLARGLAYYTGTVFEVFLKKGELSGSLAAGGRWDGMIGNYLGKGEYPAVGIAFGLAPITEVLKLKNKQSKKTLAKVFVIPIKTIKESLRVVQKLREERINSDIDLMGRGISKNLEYASSLGIPYVIFVGERELKVGKVKLRDMETGDEWMLTMKDVVKKLR